MKKDTQELIEALSANVKKVFAGSSEAVHTVLLGLTGSLHVLIQDIPGVGKTTLASAIAKSAGLQFSRIQFTPDMIPGDILGMNVWVSGLNQFKYREGPIFAQCVLADELNRTSPRTQSSFLEAMQEKQVTIDGVTRALPDPFFMIATQNPAGFTGTFPLPEAELDRFGLSFSLGYPTEDDEKAILAMQPSAENGSPAGQGSTRNAPADKGAPADVRPNTQTLEAVCTDKDIIEARCIVNGVHIHDDIRAYIVKIVRKTRSDDNIRMGCSPRGAVFLQQAAKAYASSHGRDYCIPEDVDAVCPYVLPHRIILAPQARIEAVTAAEAVRRICSTTAKPAGLRREY